MELKVVIGFQDKAQFQRDVLALMANTNLRSVD